MKTAPARTSPLTRSTASALPALDGGGRWAPGVSAVVVWLAAGAAVAYGVMHGLGRGAAVPVVAPAPAPLVVDSQAVARALGARAAANVSTAPVPADVAGRYRLLGVVAPDKASASGVALLAVQDQRPLPYRVGAVVDGRWVVQAVGKRSVVLAPYLSGQPGQPGQTGAASAPDGAGTSGTSNAQGTLTLSLPESR